MITAVDTNILLDIFSPDKKFAPSSSNLLKLAYNEGALVICEMVYAELVPQFKKKAFLDQTLSTLNISLSPLTKEIAFLSGERWGRYKKSGGSRERIITDFIIGAHALLAAERFLTRDRGFYKTYFPELKIFLNQ
jgi:predicted nucleic acid-binding protein